MSNLRPGLCSVTFRTIDAERVAVLAAQAGLSGIEWGSDVHVPPGDVKTALGVARHCADLGLSCPTYGSYVRCEDPAEDAFEAVLDSAEALGAKMIRVWAGRQGSAQADSTQRARVEQSLASHCQAAAARGMTVALEWHRDTLTDTRSSALALFDRVNHATLLSYWQRRDGQTAQQACADIDALRPRLSHAHIFWWHSYADRLPLEEGALFWRAVLPSLQPHSDGDERWVFLEFVKDDDEVCFGRDAAALLTLLGDPQPATILQPNDQKKPKLGEDGHDQQVGTSG